MILAMARELSTPQIEAMSGIYAAGHLVLPLLEKLPVCPILWKMVLAAPGDLSPCSGLVRYVMAGGRGNCQRQVLSLEYRNRRPNRRSLQDKRSTINGNIFLVRKCWCFVPDRCCNHLFVPLAGVFSWLNIKPFMVTGSIYRDMTLGVVVNSLFERKMEFQFVQPIIHVGDIMQLGTEISSSSSALSGCCCKPAYGRINNTPAETARRFGSNLLWYRICRMPTVDVPPDPVRIFDIDTLRMEHQLQRAGLLTCQKFAHHRALANLGPVYYGGSIYRAEGDTLFAAIGSVWYWL